VYKSQRDFPPPFLPRKKNNYTCLIPILRHLSP